jgi:hypothetical protein
VKLVLLQKLPLIFIYTGCLILTLHQNFLLKMENMVHFVGLFLKIIRVIFKHQCSLKARTLKDVWPKILGIYISGGRV